MSELDDLHRQIRDLQKQVVRACELRMRADERASRRNVYILNARIEKLENDLVRMWHRASGRELLRVLDLANSRGERIAELEAELERARRAGFVDDESPDSE